MDEEDGRRVDFGDFHSDTSLNILAEFEIGLLQPVEDSS